jgi:flagellum-specific peptidoglycan hydrolase FlgJ
MYRIVLLLCLVFAVGCGSSNKIRTTKKSTPTKSKTTQSKPVAKPTPKKPTPTTNTTNGSKSETLEATSNITITTDVVLDYIKAYREVAKNNMQQYGVPASITLAQGILESGAGNGRLSQIANNHFGIKCHKEWTGPSVRHDDDAAQECFRKYDDPSESYRDHSLFLTSRPRYNSLFALPKNDYKAWAKGLRAAGYATDPKYPDKLIGLIERYQLHEIDAEVLKSQPKKYEPTPATDSMTHEVIKGDTLYSLSRKYNISVAEIKKLNNLKSDALSLGQILKIK